jgi:hypothetical protein
VSTPREPQPGKAVLSVLAAGGWWHADWPGLRTALVERFGPVDYETELLPFDHTAYYEDELGAPLFRRLLGFARLLPLDGLKDMKLATNALERELAGPSGARRVNLDPGVITLERLVLASGKNFTHRVYLGCGIWADLTLIYNQRQGWVDLPWTFPDYATGDMKRRLTALRALYKTAIEASEPRQTQGEQTCP